MKIKNLLFGGFASLLMVSGLIGCTKSKTRESTNPVIKQERIQEKANATITQTGVDYQFTEPAIVKEEGTIVTISFTRYNSVYGMNEEKVYEIDVKTGIHKETSRVIGKTFKFEDSGNKVYIIDSGERRFLRLAANLGNGSFNEDFIVVDYPSTGSDIDKYNGSGNEIAATTSIPQSNDEQTAFVGEHLTKNRPNTVFGTFYDGNLSVAIGEIRIGEKQKRFIFIFENSKEKKTVVLRNPRYDFSDSNRHRYFFKDAEHEYEVAWRPSQINLIRLIVKKNGQTSMNKLLPMNHPNPYLPAELTDQIFS